MELHRVEFRRARDADDCDVRRAADVPERGGALALVPTAHYGDALPLRLPPLSLELLLQDQEEPEP